MTAVTSGARVVLTPSIAGYVTAGGQSKRFGQDKALIMLGGEVMLARLCRVVSEATGSATIVADRGRPYADFGAPVIEDLWPGEGPLGGIITAMLATQRNTAMPASQKNTTMLASQASRPACDWNLIVSCDMPFLTREFLAYLAARASASHAQAIVPESTHGPEPLCACWRTSAVGEIQAAFERGMRRVNDALKQLRTEVLDEADWKRFDSAGRLFWNMNIFADYEEAQRILAANH